MDSIIASCSTIIFFALLISQFAYGRGVRDINTKTHSNDIHLHNLHHDGYNRHHTSNGLDLTDPSLSIFFSVKDLFIGKRMPVYFSLKDPTITPHILPRAKANSIPFSSQKLPFLLQFLAFSPDSKQAKAMQETLRQCELKSPKTETKFCATSLESMLDSTRGVLGLGAKIEVLTTITPFLKPVALLQNYTFLEDPKEVLARKMVACHTMPYPYAVFYCHSQENGNKVYKVPLLGDNGDRVEAVAVCHMETSGWDHGHLAFRLAGSKPGKPVCHFMPTDNLVWVSSPLVM
jgi:hypothetical protein